MLQKLSNEATKPSFKSRPMPQKTVHRQQNQILKVVRCRKKLSTGNKTKFQKSPDVAKDCRSGAVQRSNKTKF